jgi:hypothetical protein
MSTNSETAVGRGHRSSRHISSAQGGKNMFSTSYPALKPSRFRTSQILGKTYVVLMVSHTLKKMARFTIQLLENVSRKAQVLEGSTISTMYF